MTEHTSTLLEELKRRNVIRVGLAYAVVAWLLAQVADLALESFEAPGWVMKTILLVLALGLPIALLLAWAFELTPEGIKREEQVDRSESITPQTGRKLDFAIIGLLSVALAYFVVTHDWGGADKSIGPKSVAVLPFDNMSGSEENAFFASGVHEDILTYLAKVADLRVISRTSVQRYADDRERDIKAIAAELGVGHIVEGSVRRAGNTVRVTAQLIDARTDEHVWAENYDRDLSDVFEIQTAVAQQIVAALEAKLSPDDRREINTIATTNIDAYDKYSEARAIRLGTVYGEEQMKAAEPLLAEAVALDPEFAVAHAMLGSVHTNFYWLNIDRSPQRLELAKDAIDRAFELEPVLPEARAALAEYYYRGFNNYSRALQELEAAHVKFPNNTDVLHMMGATQRRLGRWDESIESFRALTQLNPGDVREMHLLLETMIKALKWDDAADYADQLLVDYPGDANLRAKRATIYLSGFGDVAAARAEFELAGRGADFDYLGPYVLSAIAAGDFDAAMAKVEQNADLISRLPGGLEYVRSWVYWHSGERDKARALARQVVDALAPMLTQRDERLAMVQLFGAESYLRLGELEQAEAIAQRVLETNLLANDAFDAPKYRAWAARILAETGSVDEGLEVLAEIADQPGGPSKWDLRLDPAWAFMRDDPRFAAMVGLTGDDGVSAP